jgi:hypothetical protein
VPDHTLARLGRNEASAKAWNCKKLAVPLHFGLYNFVRQNHTLGTTPSGSRRPWKEGWSLEQVVEMTEAYSGRRKEEIRLGAVANRRQAAIGVGSD